MFPEGHQGKNQNLTEMQLLISYAKRAVWKIFLLNSVGNVVGHSRTQGRKKTKKKSLDSSRRNKKSAARTIGSSLKNHSKSMFSKLQTLSNISQKNKKRFSEFEILKKRNPFLRFFYIKTGLSYSDFKKIQNKNKNEHCLMFF